ncbi:MAG: single-stranded DNA-binding protein [Bacillota bacterium]|jgi:single-strand DNA-binding protein
MLNKIILIGRLTRDPELSYTASGIARLRFSLAVDRRFTNQQGERQTDFIDIVCWRQLAETCGKFLRKGRLTAVAGSLQVRSYETQDGQKRRIAEVVADEVRFLDGPKDGASTPQQQQRTGFDDFGKGLDLEEDEDNDLPF